jgi:hypothetical protein
VQQRHLPPEPPSGELESGQDIDRAGIHIDEAADVADDHVAVAGFQQHANPLAKLMDVHVGYQQRNLLHGLSVQTARPRETHRRPPGLER